MNVPTGLWLTNTAVFAFAPLVSVMTGLPPRPQESLAWTLLSLALLYFFTRTPVGRLTLALRENSQRLRFLGYEVHHLRVLVFAISAMFSGIAGGLLAVSNETANYVLFDLQYSAAVVLNTYIGGVHVFLGPALGAAVMTFFGYAV